MKPNKTQGIKRANRLIPAVALVAIAFANTTTATDLEAKKDISRQAIQAYGKALKGTLVSAMESGGPVNAVGVCNLSAPAITDSVKSDKGINVSRTSLKYRNSDNAPTDWQQQVLQEFDEKKNAGEDPGKLEYAAIVDTDDGQEYRYMKAIPTGGVCLACHGSTLSDELSAKIAEHYPDDMATGFSQGDIRGAFVVTEKLK